MRDDEIDAKQGEAEANRFAGALLIPKEAAIKAMRPPLTLHTLAQVKATFGASISMCIERAEGLALISNERATSLYKQLSSRGWRRHEPVEVPNEVPLLIRKVLELVAEGGSLSDRASSVKMPLFAYRALTATN